MKAFVAALQYCYYYLCILFLYQCFIFFFYIKRIEIWQKINPIALQLVLRDQRGWVLLGFISDYDQFGAVTFYFIQ